MFLHMGLHVIIGKGNLGIDLQQALDKVGHDARLLTASDGFEWPESWPAFHHAPYKEVECVWVAAGKGSVESAMDPHDMEDMLKTHFLLPVGLATTLPKHVRLGVFSTDYVADEGDAKYPMKHTAKPRSVYAAMKIGMEKAIYATKRPLTTIFRVGSLYGGHFPERTFPGKVAARHPNPGEVTLPQNWVTPTPSWWVAEKLAEQAKNVQGDLLFQTRGPLTHHIAPAGGCTVLQWARAILGDRYTFKSRGFDDSRPAFSNLGLSFSSDPRTWQELWAEHLVRYKTVPADGTSCTPNTPT